MNRRTLIQSVMAGSAAAALSPVDAFAKKMDKLSPGLKNNINHSVCRWTYNFLSLDELCVTAKEIGLKAIDLIGPKEWDILKKYGLDSSMCNGAEIGLTKGWNDPQYHETLIKNYTEHINLVSAAGYKNLICFSGNRNGMDDETGMNNCAEGLKKIIGLAEKKEL